MTDPTAWLFLDGQFLPKEAAAYPVEDRGTLFADGVYEVVRYLRGRAFEADRHLHRLRRSLVGIDLSVDLDRLLQHSDELMARNHLPDGKAYWQITRGSAPRQHRFPDVPRPTVLLLAYAAPPLESPGQVATRSAVLAEDNRWSDCWIKSLMLLPNVLALHRAQASGAEDAIFVRTPAMEAAQASDPLPESRITESTAGNLFMVERGVLRTPPADRWILAGITRELVLEEAHHLGLTVDLTPFSPQTLRGAEEIFLTSTTSHVTAITRLDQQPVADGTPGPITIQLHRAFMQRLFTAGGHDQETTTSLGLQ